MGDNWGILFGEKNQAEFDVGESIQTSELPKSNLLICWLK